jgi:oxygen-dependent protoporphyrinogen oxidase
MTAARLAVVGGGITGLAAAHTASTRGMAVTVFEADSRVGGVIRTSSFAGHRAIDEGADSFLARLPYATRLAEAVSLGRSLTSPAVAKAAVWWNGLHDIPDGLLLGLPTDIGSLARSQLLSPAGKIRAALEPLRPRTDLHADSIGAYVRARFGDEVHERLVDPLIGSIYAADTDDFSLAAVPQLAELAGRSRSVLLAGRHRPPAPAGPVFYAPLDGMGALVEAVADQAILHGADIRCATPVSELAADGPRWRVDGEAFDAVVLACPARVTADLLASVAPDASTTLGAIPSAGVALLTLALPRADWPERLEGLSGYLVPKPQQRLVTAVSFGSQKWAHWNDPEHVVVRVSLGRDGLSVLHLSDDELLTEVFTELDTRLEVLSQPLAARVSRWPNAFPQYRPHHGDTISAVQRALPAGLALAGASYHGIGVPSCVHSGQEAMTTLIEATSLAD